LSISVKALSKTYGTQKAVDEISFEAKPGKILGFLGPNGAGKSTTMKILTCYLPQTSGEASICGFDISNQSLEVRKLIGYLPESNPLYLDMYVKEFLYFVGNIYHLRNLKTRVEEVILATGLGKEKHKKIGELSKGYKQRVGLAQAIIHDPKVLILDEPTSGLDPNQLIEIRKLIKELGKTKTVILSTHIMQEVEAICDDVIIINKGKIVANNSLNNLLTEYGETSLEPIFVKLTKE
jgi:ABC-2 type transport system ATP-binding protein